MELEVLDYTHDPVAVISRAMGTCYGREDTVLKRVQRAYVQQHMSVFEHAHFTVSIKGVSRACSHQLVRHRMASFCQESQRYVKIDTDNEDWYVIPPHVEPSRDFRNVCAMCADEYQAMIASGIAAEDARYILPNATKTNLVMTMNIRELYHFLELRDDDHAQWEIRELAQRLRHTLCCINESWADMMRIDNTEWNVV